MAYNKDERGERIDGVFTLGVIHDGDYWLQPSYVAAGPAPDPERSATKGRERLGAWLGACYGVSALGRL
jgi:hypothetical protein